MFSRVPNVFSFYKKVILIFNIIFLNLVAPCVHAQQSVIIKSPASKIFLQVEVSKSGELNYSIKFNGAYVVEKSSLGLAIKDASALDKNFNLIKIDSSTVNESWSPVLGEVKSIKNHYAEVKIYLEEKDGLQRQMNLIFRVFDDGVGLRYELPSQKNLSNFILSDELTNFNLTGDHKTWWIPGDYDSNEYPYTTSLLSEVDAVKKSNLHSEIAVRVVSDPSNVQTPLMMKSKDGLYINIHEAALVNYPSMQLHIDKSNFSLKSELIPDAVGNKAYLATPCVTPWRTIMITDKASDILNSKLILNLNDPSKIKDVSWIKPTKMIGIWWEMHINKSTWDYAGSQDIGNWSNLSNLKPSGKHGATTHNTKRYIDFAAAHGFDGVLVEGWNIGWEDWFGKWKEDVFDFITPYPDFNVRELKNYAAKKGVKIIMHHETSGSATNYERCMESAYQFMKKNGYDAVKTGYVGKIIPRGEHHDGQWMVNHYNRVAMKTAENRIMVDMHESVRPTGMHRTYPNWIANEAARGNEFNAWSQGNPPEHETILPFTRLLGGPMDYTPGIFQIKLDKYGKKDNYVHTTLAKQLALYVTMYSPLQMAADLPENYEAHMDAFQFIKDVALDWDDSVILEAEPGDFITIARKEKGKQNWFIGGITDENARISEINLSFLNPGQKYKATIYRDGKDAHWDKNPSSYIIEKMQVDAKSNISIQLAEGGGYAVSIIPEVKIRKIK